jgi:DNA (cytosine-5)-methyltransferase 1
VLVDLCCGAGGATKGYQRAGFYVIGVDIEPQPNYCGDEFVQADVLTYVHRGEVHALHASPPCQINVKGFAAVNRSRGRDLSHADLIPPVRAALQTTGVPYVIENVVGAALKDPIRLCGSSFGLAVRRHRLFESNVPLMAMPCAHHLQSEAKYPTNWRPGGERRLATAVQVYGNAAGTHLWPEAMGIDWMTTEELAEAIPPAYTEHIGGYLMAALTKGEGRGDGNRRAGRAAS